MIRYENQCCGCATPGYPCVGRTCSFRNAPVYYCDFCGEQTTCLYSIEGEHYCDECAQAYLEDCFDELSLSDKAEVLNIGIGRLDS